MKEVALTRVPFLIAFSIVCLLSVTSIIVAIGTHVHASPPSFVIAEQLPVTVGGALMSIDYVSQRGDRIPLVADHYAISRGKGDVAVGGWSVDSVAAAAPSTDVLIVDNVVFLRSRSRIQRGDVAAALGNQAYLSSGFEGVVPLSLLKPGRHVVSLGTVSAAMDRIYQSPPLHLVVR